MNGIKKISEKEAIRRLMELCSRAEKSSYDIRKKLAEWGLEKESEKIIGSLTKGHFIDDFRYARAFVIDKIRLNKWGILKVRYLLKSKQITSIDIEKAILALDYEEYRKMVFTELARKQHSLNIKDPYKLKSKLYAFAGQRGYESILINEFIESTDLP
jgi:regulatory protein